MIKLSASCPFCGDEYQSHVVIEPGPFNDTFTCYVKCEFCHASGPRKYSVEEAVAVWESVQKRKVSKLKCPWCGSKVTTFTTVNDKFYCKCLACGLRTPLANTRNQARKLWRVFEAVMPDAWEKVKS